MNIIIPMAGRGSRLRPHTLTIPKPLIPVGGKPIIYRLVEDIISICATPIQEIAFVTGDFGKDTEKELILLAEQFGAKGSVYIQEKPLGTAHAVLCAKEKLDGAVVVAFADTLFKADFTIDSEDEGILWVKKIEDPSSFGVIKMNDKNEIIDFVEKPKTPVSDLAMIGVYYFKEGATLKNELDYLIENNIIKDGEYQLPDALRRMVEKGTVFKPGEVNEWLDCGNKTVTVITNKRVLDFDYGNNKKLVDDSAVISNSIVIPPCYVGENAVLKNCIIGPHVSVGSNSEISNSVIKNSILQQNVNIKNLIAENSMIGNNSTIHNSPDDLSVGDYTNIQQ